MRTWLLLRPSNGTTLSMVLLKIASSKVTKLTLSMTLSSTAFLKNLTTTSSWSRKIKTPSSCLTPEKIKILNPRPGKKSQTKIFQMVAASTQLKKSTTYLLLITRSTSASQKTRTTACEILATLLTTTRLTTRTHSLSRVLTTSRAQLSAQMNQLPPKLNSISSHPTLLSNQITNN